MWSAIIINCVLSITIIFIANQIWDYCKNNYTSQKTKNLAEIHASKYKQIAEDMERYAVATVSDRSISTTHTIGNVEKREDSQTVGFLPKDEKEWMNKELAEFIDTL
jgi:hypothetical protein